MSKMTVTSHYSVNNLAIDLISRQGSCVIHHHYFKLAISCFLTRNSRTSAPLFAYSLDFGVFLNFESSSTSNMRHHFIKNVAQNVLYGWNLASGHLLHLSRSRTEPFQKYLFHICQLVFFSKKKRKKKSFRQGKEILNKVGQATKTQLSTFSVEREKKNF